MIKTIFIKSDFIKFYRNVEVKIPTGEVTKGFFGGEKQVTKKVTETRAVGKSDCIIDGEKLSEDLRLAAEELVANGYSILSITPIISGEYQYKGLDISSSARIVRDTEKISGTGGYGFGFSYTQGIVVLAQKKS